MSHGETMRSHPLDSRMNDREPGKGGKNIRLISIDTLRSEMNDGCPI